MLHTFRCEKCKKFRVSRSTDFTRIKPLIFAKNHTKPIGNNASGKFLRKSFTVSLLAPWPICYPAARMRMHAFTSGLGSYRMLCSTTCIRHTFFFLVGIEPTRERRSFSSSTIKNLSASGGSRPVMRMLFAELKKIYINIFFLVNYN